jgi:predicted DsbA family dithiol-disulfide isomerase
MEAMAREQYGIDINAGPFGVDSRPALVGAKFAESEGVGEAYHTAVFKAYWQAAKKIDELDILADIAVSVGLNPDDFLSALTLPDYEARVQFDLEQAFAYGLTGVPALVFQNKYLVVGAQPYDILAQVADKVLAET